MMPGETAFTRMPLSAYSIASPRVTASSPRLVNEANAAGTPAIATGWGGHLDYLGADWPGAVPSRMAQVPVWPPERPSYWPSQRWADPDVDAAVAAMRSIVADPRRARAAASSIAERIANRYAEPVVAREYLAALE